MNYASTITVLDDFLGNPLAPLHFLRMGRGGNPLVPPSLSIYGEGGNPLVPPSLSTYQGGQSFDPLFIFYIILWGGGATLWSPLHYQNYSEAV